MYMSICLSVCLSVYLSGLVKLTPQTGEGSLVVIKVYSELSFAVGFGVFLTPQETASKKRRSSTVSLEGVMQELFLGPQKAHKQKLGQQQGSDIPIKCLCL